LDSASGWLLQGLVVFTAWAFGGGERWVVWVSTALSLVLGLLWVAKRVVAWREDFQPVRWGDAEPDQGEDDDTDTDKDKDGEGGGRRREWLVGGLAVVQLLFLGVVGFSLVNAGAGGGGLPGTLDRVSTMEVWLECLGLVGVFWAARDWLLYRSARDRKEVEREKGAAPDTEAGAILVPTRLRQLLWVLCLNGAALAVVGFLQRAGGTAHLFGVLSPGAGLGAEAVFGPWANRVSAGHYFNLLWPVCLGAWLWFQERAARTSESSLARFDGPQVVLLPCMVLLAVVPPFTGGPGGTLVSLALILISAGVVLSASRRDVARKVRWVTVAAIGLAGLLGLASGGSGLVGRLTRPDHLLVTGVQAGTDPFTLIVRLRPVERPPSEWTPLVEVRDAMSASDRQRSLGVGLDTEGGLVVQMTGATAADANRRVSERFVSLFGSREVLLAVVRDRELRLYIDGQELGSVDGRMGDAPGWSGPVGTRYLNVLSRTVGEVALVDAALTVQDLAGLGRAGGGLKGLEQSMKAARPYVVEGPVLKEGLVPADGAVVEFRPDSMNRSRVWMRLKRKEFPGPLGFRRDLAGIDPRFNGAVMVSFSVLNSQTDPMTLRVCLDDGKPAVVEVPPRTEKAVSVRCQVPHEGPPRTLDLGWGMLFEGERLSTGVPMGADLTLRDLRIEPVAAWFRQALDAEVGVAVAARPTAGSAEAQVLARRMIAAHPIWGTGAGTFPEGSARYAGEGRPGAERAPTDWLQVRSTLGWAGVGLLGVGFVVLLLRGWRGPGMPTLGVIVGLVWMALAATVVSGVFDAPFQAYSVLFLAVVLAAMTTGLSVVRGRR
jgi:hypothetical protein